MTEKSNSLFHEPSSTRQFLVSKTSLLREHKKDERIGDSPPEELKNKFPDLLTGNAFMKESMEHLNSTPALSAMAILMDQPDIKVKDSNANNREIKIKIELADILNKISQKENGVWGVLGSDLFGFIFPDKNGAKAEKLAKNVKTTLSKISKNTVTIGIARYPTIHFIKEQVMDNARKALEHAEFFGPDSMVSFDAVSLNISGDKYYDQGDIHQAIEEFKAALLLDPSNVNVHNSMGVCYGVQNDYKNALDEFMIAVKYDPNETMALYNVGLANNLMGNHEKALEFFLKAHDKNGEIFEIILQTGILYTEIKKPDKGKEFLEKAVQMEPESAVAYSSLGDCYQALNLIDHAISAYKKAIRKNPYDAASLSALGKLYDIKGENLEIAILFCRQSVDLAPENGLYRSRLGELYFKENHFEDALVQFKKAGKLGHDCDPFIEKIQKQLAGGKN